MNAAQNVTATFVSGGGQQHPLTVTVNIPNAGNVTIGGASPAIGTTNHPAGSQVMLVAAPNSGFTFAGWGGVAGCASAINCQVTMTSAQTVSANFIAGVSVSHQINHSITHWGLRRTSSGVSIAGPVGTSADVVFYNIRGVAVHRQSVTGGTQVNIGTGSGIVPAGNYIVVLRDRATGRELHRSQVSLVN